MSTIAELRMKYTKIAEEVYQHPGDPANLLRNAELLVLQDQIRMLEEMAKDETCN